MQTATNGKVLVVDDSALVRLRCGKLLRENGFEVFEAKDGSDGVAAYIQESPDVVLMDMLLPGINGLQATIRIREIDPKATVVMFTSMATERTLRDCVKAGLDGFIAKPWDDERLLSTMQQLVQRKKKN